MKLAVGRYALATAAVGLPLLGGLAGAYATWNATVAAAERDFPPVPTWHSRTQFDSRETERVILREIDHAIAGHSDGELENDQAALHAELARLASALPQIWDVLVWGRDGSVIATAKIYPVPQSNGADREYFRALANGAPEPFVSTVMMGRLDNVTFFNITVARREESGTFAGAEGVALDPNFFERSYLDTGLADPAGGNGIALLRSDGTLLARAPAGLGQRGEVWQDFVQEVHDAPAAGHCPGPPGGPIWSLEYRRVPGLPLYVLASLTTDELRYRWWESTKNTLWFVIPATALMLLLVTQVLRRSVAADRSAKEAARRADELARSEARARALFVNSPDVRTITQETEDGRFIFIDVNDAVLETFQWTREQVVGKTAFEIYPAAMAEEVVEKMRECLRLGHPITYQARRIAAGEARYFETTLAPVIDPAGSGPAPRMIVTNARDITEWRKVQDHLRESQKMETLSQLAGELAHDFNNILVVVGGQLERLQIWLDRHVTDDQPRRYLGHAASGLDRGAALVRRMLSFARRQEARPEALDIAVLLTNLADFVRVTVGAGIEVITDMPSQEGHKLLVRADPTQIELAVVNLALNARDAMPRGGTITLGLAGRSIAVDEADLAAGHYAVLEVRDTGEGMDEATLARAAEPFFTTKEAGKGTGLGLAMVRGLAVQTGGALRLHSTPGAGTTVALWLPLAEAPTSALPGLRARD